MSLVNAKCPNCGQPLKVDNEIDSAICEFCGSAFIVEKAIQNFKINNTVNVGAGAVVNVFGNVSDDFVIEAGKLKAYKGAATDVIIPNTVKEIGSDVFSGLSITSVTISNSVTSIGFGAFHGCSELTSITIPDSVISIGIYAFRGCNGLKTAGPIGSGSDYQFGWKTLIPCHAFDECSSLTSITIPNTVTSIGENAFSNCSSLTSISIPKSVMNIGEYSFSDCSSLTSISIPKSVTSIGNGAFEGCSSLTSIAIPDSITSIAASVFASCSKLTNVTIPDSVTSIGTCAFAACYGLTSILIPSSVESICSSAFQYCRGLTSITIPDSVTSIGKSAFMGCSSLTSITIPDSVTSIGKSAFMGCSSLTSITIPDSVLNIEQLAFYNCNSLTHIIANRENKQKVKASKKLPNLSGGCYVATAVYGSYDCPEVWTLRRFRDYSLAMTWYGRLFIALYYAISPTIVKWFGHTQWFNKIWRGRLDKMVKNLQEQGFEDTPYQDKR